MSVPRVSTVVLALGACASGGPKPAPEPAPERTMKVLGVPADEARLSPREVDEVIRTNRDAIWACHEAAVERGSAASGRVLVELTIAGDGSVERATVAETTLDSPAIEDCMVGVIAALQFPAKGGAVVRYPFVFASE